MRRIVVISFLVLWLIPNFADAQRWNRYRRSLIGGVGLANLLGDLGGGDEEGRGGPLDMDIPATRPSLTIGYRYQVNNFFFLRTNLNWGILKGSDEYTLEPARRGRNLNFRTGFWELNVLGEFYLISNSNGNLYRIRGVRGRRGLGIDVYLYAGIGAMYFNPKAEYQGSYVALQPIGTGGQGLPGGGDKYSRITMTIPYGIGFGKNIDRYWTVNFEITMRQTFSDYIDDVSGDYYGRDRIYNEKIAAGASVAEAQRAAYLSDPNIYHIQNDDSYSMQPDMEGELRGDSSDNDAFFTAMFTISR
ncbi:MAG: hypothetical protein CMP59_05995, partial [Flavobacteriales bacterium]|nr:hypothetical protein [Flavobacteriales bacterium]